jgi:hypothetical protein
VLLSDVHHRAGKHGGVLQQNHVPQWLLSIRGQFRAVWNVTTPGPPEITTFLLVIFGIARGAARSLLAPSQVNITFLLVIFGIARGAARSLLAPSQGHRRAHLARSLSSRGRTRRGSFEAAQVKLAEAYIQGHYRCQARHELRARTRFEQRRNTTAVSNRTS